MLTALLILLLVLIVLLAVPLTLTFRFVSSPKRQKDVRLEWAFGLVRIAVGSEDTEAAKRKARRPHAKPGSRKGFGGNGKNVIAAIREKPFRRRMVRYVGAMWRAVNKHNVRLRIRVGLGDPADTGRLWALLGPIAGMAACLRDALISIEPEFFESTLAVDGSGRIRVIPLQLLYLTAALLLSPPVWRGIRLIRAAK